MLEEFYELDSYALGKEDKIKLLTKELKEITAMHSDKCPEYANMLKAFGYDESKVETYYDLPFFPVRMFKQMELLSVDKKAVFKTMTSSGTTGQAVSKIFVDKETAASQQKVLVKIMSNFIGKKRLPMLIVDSPKVVKDRNLFSARGAAILGLSMLAKERVYALDEDMNLNLEVVKDFLEAHKGERFLIFGFTFMVWQHFYKELIELENKGEKLDMSEAFLITGGGWKKLESEHVSREEYKERFEKVCGITHFLDHYGMVEQTGCVYAECECGHLHASIYSDVITRRYEDFSPCEIGEKGIIQVVSVLPRSYPGHSILTEDEGIVLGEDDCPCGRKGKYIQITGRMKKAELRGCSDTYAAKF